MFSTPQKKSDMTGGRMVAALLVVVFGSAAFSATINVRIETDKAGYKVGCHDVDSGPEAKLDGRHKIPSATAISTDLEADSSFGLRIPYRR